MRTFAERLKIQTDNLCQFLPQDVVRNFPSMSPGEVLTNTIRAVGDGDLLEVYDKLKIKENKVVEMDDTLSKKDGTLRDLKRKSENMENIRQSEMNKARLEERLQLHQRQEMYLDLLVHRRNANKLGREQKDRAKKKDEAAERLRVAESALTEYNEKKNKLTDELKTLNRGRDECQRLLSDSFVESCQQRVEESIKALDRHDKQKAHKKKQLAELDAEIKRMEKNYYEMPTDESLKNEKDKAVGIKSEADAAKERLEQERKDLEQESSMCSRRITSIQSRMSQLKSAEEQKLHTLSVLNRDAYRGVLFLRENNNRASFFRGTVHDPVMTTIRLKKPEYAVHVQKLIGKTHFETFVCEEIADMHTLTNKLRKELKLRRINAAHSKPDPRYDWEWSL